MTNSNTSQRTIFVSSNREERRIFEEAFHHVRPDSEIMQVSDCTQCHEMLSDNKVDAIFLDSILSSDNSDYLQEFNKRNANIPVIVLVDPGKERDAAEAIKNGAYDFIVKDENYDASLRKVIQRLQQLSPLNRDSEADLHQKSFLFQRIHKSQKWWQNIIDAITDYLFVIDENYKILRTNKAFANLFGKEPADIIMQPYYELFGMDHPHEWCISTHNDKDFCPRSVERTINEMDYLISCFPIYFDEHNAVVYIMKDITENRRLKDQIYHLDKLSSLGTLTSGVAHEINNPLTGIIGYTEMLLMKEESEGHKKYLHKVYDSAIRCKRIVENMLTFSRQTSTQKSLESINDIIDKTIELHEYWLKSTNIEIVKNYEAIPSVLIDRQQIQQVILNLIINAEYAIAESGNRGRIECTTAYDEERKKIVIKISDNGTGIPQDLIPKIFDPFFTTKPVNKGTGLGLSIAHGIIAEQGGTIETDSAPGKGTTFIITIPKS